MKISKYKNPWFWIGLISIMIAASGVDFSQAVTWSILWQSLISIVQNPVTLLAVILAGLGVFVNPTTKGFKD